MLLINVMVLCGIIWFVYEIIVRYRPGSMKSTSADAPLFIQLIQIIFFVLLFVKSAGYFGIELIMVVLTALTGLCWLGYLLYRRLTKKINSATDYHWIKNLGTFFPILLIVLILRSFLLDPYRIPSGSLLPTVQIGDFILVNKYQYGLRLPVVHKKIMHLGEPQVGDIMVFLWPVNPSIYMIKRVIGLPGDRIRYTNKILYRNDKPVLQKFLNAEKIFDEQSHQMTDMVRKIEYLNNKPHDIYIKPNIFPQNMEEITVPAGTYFMMGDNRDGSADSRYWGFVPDKNIIGKASFIWLSWDSTKGGLLDKIRWNRIGRKI